MQLHGTVRATRDISLHEKAASDLSFIRSAMERAGSFTAVPGAGGALMGASALLASWVASRQEAVGAWLTVWLVEAVVAVAIGAVTMTRKSRRMGVPLSGAVARRFALSFSAPMVVGAVLTASLYARGDAELLPAVWLLSYGAAVVAGGTMSVLAVPLMGAGMLVAGAGAAVVPAWGDAWLAIGFGVLQVAAGVWIARRHGG